MSRPNVRASFFVFVVVEHEGQVLVVREAKHGQLWYAPAGGLEPGETIRDAAVRETLEEAGVRIEPTGLVRVEQQWFNGGDGLSAWMRFLVTARPASRHAIAPKRHADRHSLEARWVRPDEIACLPLRHAEVPELVALARSSPAAPL